MRPILIKESIETSLSNTQKIGGTQTQKSASISQSTHKSKVQSQGSAIKSGVTSKKESRKVSDKNDRFKDKQTDHTFMMTNKATCIEASPKPDQF